MGSAVNVWMLYAGRALAGLCVGFLTLTLPVYLGETIQAEIRGTLGLLPTTLGNGGLGAVVSSVTFGPNMNSQFLSANIRHIWAKYEQSIPSSQLQDKCHIWAKYEQSIPCSQLQDKCHIWAKCEQSINCSQLQDKCHIWAKYGQSLPCSQLQDKCHIWAKYEQSNPCSQ